MLVYTNASSISRMSGLVDSVVESMNACIQQNFVSSTLSPLSMSQLHALLHIAYCCNFLRCMNYLQPNQLHQHLLHPTFQHYSKYRLKSTNQEAYIDLSWLLLQMLQTECIEGHSNTEWYQLLLQEYALYTCV